MTDRIKELEKRLYETAQELFEARKETTPEPVQDYTLRTADGDVKLSELFGDHDTLLLTHNMGKACSYCTLWADMFSCQLPHLERVTAFVVCSPDSPDVQAAIKSERGWEFDMVQDASGDMTKALGFFDGEHWHPGVSALVKGADGSITRKNYCWYGPGDAFCPVWHYLSLLPGGGEGWEPK